MGLSGKLHLNVSIGPVQGFVAQSRRTRDLWGSSYLLSYLSATAAFGVSQTGAKIVRPALDLDPLFQWVSQRAKAEDPPQAPPAVGSVPNHFVVEVESVEAGKRAAEAAVDALRHAWDRLCQVVWDTYVADAEELGVGVAAIWRRQTEQYWEVTWTISPPEEAGPALARRKLWRTHRLPDEPGDKCMVMPDFQELSGYVRARGKRESEAQDRFWEEIRRKAGPLNLPPGDRLCAIALVKRLFADVSNRAIGGQIEVFRWPSTVDVGAAPWVDRVLKGAPEKAREYALALAEVAPKAVFAARRAIGASVAEFDTGGFERLNGNYYHVDSVLNDDLCVLNEKTPEESERIRHELAAKLKAIAETIGPDQKRIGRPSIYYALLLADGDRLGELLQVYRDNEVSEALSRFSRSVPEIVRRHSGVVVYAGGDDVLAMLPITMALECARELAHEYRTSFHLSSASGARVYQQKPTRPGDETAEASPYDRTSQSVEPTLSAAVLFAHARAPLSGALREVRRLLDDVAKDGNGRDSIAIGILKRGGLSAQWVSTWHRRRYGDEQLIDSVSAVQTLASHLDQKSGGELSTSLLYRLRSTLGRLCDWPAWSPGSWGELLEGVELPAFIRAEVWGCFGHNSAGPRGTIEDGRERAEELVQAILDVLIQSRRGTVRKAGSDLDVVGERAGFGPAANGGKGRVDGTGEHQRLLIGIDGLLVARFLAAQGEVDD